jgi:hypothetical protein
MACHACGNRCDRHGAPTRPLEGACLVKFQVPYVRHTSNEDILNAGPNVRFFSKVVRFAPENGHLLLVYAEPFVSPCRSFVDGALLARGCHMNEDLIAPWLMQYPGIWTALLTGLAPAMIASFRRRSLMRWYVYGFACSLVAWPLVTLPTVHAFLLRPRSVSPELRQRRRRADALALLAESSVRSYPTWIADLKRKSPDGVDRRRYVYEKIRPGDSIELIRENTDRYEHAIAFRHRGVYIGYVPKRHFWLAHAIDDGRRLLAIVDKVKVGGIFRRRAKSVGVRIVVLNAR